MACLVTSRGALHYTVYPPRSPEPVQGPPLLLIPGLAATTTAFPEVVEDVTAARPVITFDPYGAGLSRSRRPLFRLADIAADAIRLLDHLAVRQVHVLGISMGGMIAQELALGWPERVRTLHLACTTCGWPDGEPPPREVVIELVAGLSRVHRVRSAADADRLFRGVLFAPETPEAVRLAFFANRRRAPVASPMGLTAQMLAVRRFGTGARLRHLRVPTQVLTGVADRLMPPENSHRLADRIPGAILVETPGGHVFFTEARERFRDHLADAMARRDGH